MTATIAVIRVALFASLMILFGASAFSLLLHRRPAQAQQEEPRLRGFFVAAAIVALIATLSSLPVAAASMGGSWQSAVDLSAIGAVVRHTRFGNLLVLRLFGSLALLIACARSLRFEVVCILAAGLLVLLSLTSHAAASASAPDIALARAANDAAHILAGGFWLGSLVVLIRLFGAPSQSTAGFLQPVRLFSEWGTYAVALLVVTGTVNVATVLFSGHVTWSSMYQQLLAAKVFLAAIMIVLAGINRWRLTPAASGGDQHAPRALSRNIAAELSLGLGVITIAGIVGSIAPG